jgi:hypothetical protein
MKSPLSRALTQSRGRQGGSRASLNRQDAKLKWEQAFLYPWSNRKLHCSTRKDPNDRATKQIAHELAKLDVIFFLFKSLQRKPFFVPSFCFLQGSVLPREGPFF